MSTWSVYVIECNDGSWYTGVSTDPERRLVEHNGTSRGARYTRSRRPVIMVACRECADQSEALRRERRFKKLSARDKRKSLDRL